MTFRGNSSLWTFLSRLLLCLLCTAGCFAMSALGEDGILLEIGMSTYPEALVEPGDVTLTITVCNASPSDTSNLYLSSPDGALYESLGCVGAGDTQVFTRTHAVTEEELDAGTITYVISCENPTGASEGISYTLQASILREEASPQVEFTRRVSGTSVNIGDVVTIIYGVRNTGNVSVHDLQIEDAPLSFSGYIEELDVGASSTLISRVTAVEGMLSEPTLCYSVESDDASPYTRSLTAMDFPVADAQLVATLTADEPRDSSVLLTLELCNVGNTDLSDITVTDALHGGIIAEEIEIPCGSAPVYISHTFPLRGDDQACWRITGRDESGKEIDLMTEVLALSRPATLSGSELTISAAAATPKINRSGNVRLRVHLENTGDADLEDVVLTEASIGEIRTFAVVPAHGSIDREITRYVSEDAQFVFRLDYTDVDGWSRSVEAEPVTVTIASDGADPEGAKPAIIEFTGTSLKIGGSALFGTLLLIACGVLIVLVIILIVATHRARIEKQVRIAAERQRRRQKARKDVSSADKKTKKGKA